MRTLVLTDMQEGYLSLKPDTPKGIVNLRDGLIQSVVEILSGEFINKLIVIDTVYGGPIDPQIYAALVRFGKSRTFYIQKKHCSIDIGSIGIHDSKTRPYHLVLEEAFQGNEVIFAGVYTGTCVVSNAVDALFIRHLLHLKKLGHRLLLNFDPKPELLKVFGDLGSHQKSSQFAKVTIDPNLSLNLNTGEAENAKTDPRAVRLLNSKKYLLERAEYFHKPFADIGCDNKELLELFSNFPG